MMAKAAGGAGFLYLALTISFRVEGRRVLTEKTCVYVRTRHSFPEILSLIPRVMRVKGFSVAAVSLSESQHQNRAGRKNNKTCEG
jgi:hypothetical protein